LFYVIIIIMNDGLNSSLLCCKWHQVIIF